MSKKSFSLLCNKFKMLFLLLFLFSCGKEECKQCFNAVESNEAQAILKCNGLANNYPAMDYGETFAGTKCGDDIDNFTDGGRRLTSTSNQKCVQIKRVRYKVCR